MKFEVGDIVQLKTPGNRKGSERYSLPVGLPVPIREFRGELRMLLTLPPAYKHLEGHAYLQEHFELVKKGSPMKTVSDKIREAKAEALAAEAKLAELMALPPAVGDVYWNGKSDFTKSTVMAVIGDRLWYDNSNQKAQGFVQPIDYFSKLGYERYVA